MVPGADATIGWFTLVLAVGIISLLILTSTVLPLRRMYDQLQQRFIFGVPWGSLVVVGILFFVYLFVQHGWWHYRRPVVVAYTAVSMYDPTGWVFAGLAHSSPGHLRANVTTTLVFAPIVEYIWGHYPRTTRRNWEPAWAQHPIVRAVVVFPLGVLLVAIIAALFSWGPVIGFSVAAFALIGCALVYYPVLAVVGLVARSAVRVLWRTVTDPVVVTETTVRTVRPDWFGTAVQGHLVGLLLGVIIGIGLLRYHRVTPAPARVFGANLLAGFFLSVWAIWWIIGPEAFVLFRALGVALVIGVAGLVALAVGTDHIDPVHMPRWNPATSALGILLVAVLGMGVIGIGLNFALVENPDHDPQLEIQDYTIMYGEDIPDGMINIVDVEAFGLTTDVRTSGVVVVSEQRNVWRQMVSSTELETHGRGHFTVGGIGWSERIIAERTGWTPVGNDTVYQIDLHSGETTIQAFESEPSTASAVIENHSIRIQIEDEAFVMAVLADDAIHTVELPNHGENVTVNDLTITRTRNQIVAATDGSAVVVAERETYQ